MYVVLYIYRFSETKSAIVTFGFDFLALGGSNFSRFINSFTF